MTDDGQRQVLFTRSDMRLAGPGRLMIAQAEALRNEGVSVVFATGGGALADVVTAKAFEHHEIPDLGVENRSAAGTARAMRAMHSLVKRTRPAVVHAFNAHAAVCAVPAAQRFNATVLSTVTGRGKERSLRFVPAHFVAVSDFVRERLMTYGLAGDRITVIPNATIADDQVANDAELAELQSARLDVQRGDTVELCSVAMFTGGKGQDLIIDVLAELSSRNAKKIRVTFVGDGPSRVDCEGRARAKGVGDWCEFVGAQSDVLPFLDRASVFVHLALEETFGLVLAEAGARGLPVIAHRVGGIPEVVRHGATGLIVPYRSISAVADAIERLALAPDLQLELGRNGRDRVWGNYRMSVSADLLLDLYRSRGVAIR